MQDHQHSLVNSSKLNEIPSLDWGLSLKLASGKHSLATNLLAIMINNLPKDKRLINSAFNSHNLKVLRDNIHKLHGSCCYTGLAKLKYIAKTLEQQIVLGNYTEITKGMSYINNEIDYLVSNYNNLKLLVKVN